VQKRQNNKRDRNIERKSSLKERQSQRFTERKKKGERQFQIPREEQFDAFAKQLTISNNKDDAAVTPTKEPNSPSSIMSFVVGSNSPLSGWEWEDVAEPGTAESESAVKGSTSCEVLQFDALQEELEGRTSQTDLFESAALSLSQAEWESHAAERSDLFETSALSVSQEEWELHPERSDLLKSSVLQVDLGDFDWTLLPPMDDREELLDCELDRLERALFDDELDRLEKGDFTN
jgi:hypothetical protein